MSIVFLLLQQECYGTVDCGWTWSPFLSGGLKHCPITLQTPLFFQQTVLLYHYSIELNSAID